MPKQKLEYEDSKQPEEKQGGPMGFVLFLAIALVGVAGLYIGFALLYRWSLRDF